MKNMGVTNSELCDEMARANLASSEAKEVWEKHKNTISRGEVEHIPGAWDALSFAHSAIWGAYQMSVSCAGSCLIAAQDGDKEGVTRCRDNAQYAMDAAYAAAAAYTSLQRMARCIQKPLAATLAGGKSKNHINVVMK